MAKKFDVLEGVPKNMGRGEGGGTVPKIYDLLHQIDQKLKELDDKVNDMQEGE